MNVLFIGALHSLIDSVRGWDICDGLWSRAPAPPHQEESIDRASDVLWIPPSGDVFGMLN